VLHCGTGDFPAKAVVKAKAGKQNEALKMMALGGSIYNARQKVADSIDKLIEINVGLAKIANKQGDDTFAGATMFMAVTSVAALILALLIGLVLTRSMANPLAAITRVVLQVASGDFSNRSPPSIWPLRSNHKCPRNKDG
jgi:methyl-accepting chemotaxis protein